MSRLTWRLRLRMGGCPRRALLASSLTTCHNRMHSLSGSLLFFIHTGNATRPRTCGAARGRAICACLLLKPKITRHHLYSP